MLSLRLVEAGAESSASSHRCSPRSRSGSKATSPSVSIHPSPRELFANRIGGAREHDLRSGGLRQAHHLHERDDRRGVHARHAPQIDHQEPRRGGLFHPPADPLQQAVRRSEEDEPGDPQQLDLAREPAELGALGRRPIDVGAIGLAEGDLTHQLDPAVADGEQHDRENQADHHAPRNPHTMIPTRITTTTAYSSGGSNLRLSQTHSTRKARPMKTSTPPTIIRGISPTTEAPNTTAASGTVAAIEPGGPRVHAHALRERGE